MLKQWIAMEHYRLHTVELWPESDYKQAMLAAIRSTLESLSTGHPSEQCDCGICRC